MPARSFLLSALVGSAFASECIDSATITAWTGPLNEPCYVHDSACEGYPVCCVTTGTCVSTHGGMVSSNALYYEGGCYSDSSSTGITGAGCEGKVGECNAPYLESAMGGTTREYASGDEGGTLLMTAIPDDVLTRLSASNVQDLAPCVSWASVTWSVVLDGASTDDFSGYYSPLSTMCTTIAETVGVNDAYVDCTSAEAARRKMKMRRLQTGGVEITAVIQCVGTGVDAGSVADALVENLGTAEQITTALSTDTYPVTVTVEPTMSAVSSDGEAMDNVFSAGLGTGTLIIIIVAAIVVVLVVVVAVKMMGGKKEPAEGKTGA
jgi:hypothetical protein